MDIPSISTVLLAKISILFLTEARDKTTPLLLKRGLSVEPNGSLSYFFLTVHLSENQVYNMYYSLKPDVSDNRNDSNPSEPPVRNAATEIDKAIGVVSKWIDSELSHATKLP